MVAKFTTDTIPEFYDEGCLPWPEDEVPDRIPIEMMQSPTIRQTIFILYHYFGSIPTLFIDSNTPLRFNPNNRRVFIAPDICVAFDVDVVAIALRESYDLWEVGKPPEFALEVASRSTHRKDLYEKPDIYAHIGVGEYWMFDPTGGELYGQTLAGFRLEDGRYEPIEIAPNEHGLESGYSETLGLRLCAVERSRHSELVDIQPNIFFEEHYYPAQMQMLLQDSETGLYLLDPRGLVDELGAAQAALDTAQAERDAAQVEAARLRELLRRLKED